MIRWRLEQEEEQTLSVGLPPNLQPGLVWVECQKGGLVSAAVPLLVTPSRALADELETYTELVGNAVGLLTDLGLVLGALQDGADLMALQGTVRKCGSTTVAPEKDDLAIAAST